MYSESIDMLLKRLGANAKTGFSSVKASDLLQKYGPNQLISKPYRSWWRILLAQFNNLLVVLLIVASVLSFQLNAYRDGIVLSIIVVVNALIGFFQDWKSENILQSLKTLIAEKSTVIRDGNQVQIPAEDLVPGDIVVINEGEGVAADMRLLESSSLYVNEFILTGESDASHKNHKAELSEMAAITDKVNMVFMGTSIAKGHAKGLVIATGMDTEIGQIAGKAGKILQGISPLQKEINLLARRITVITILLGISIFAFSIFLQWQTAGAALVFAISIAAAMVPEGLPAQISIALALGVRRLARKKAVVKQLSSVETLGSATVIASDKTGTITKNEMSINNCLFDGQHIVVSGTGYQPEGQLLSHELIPLSKDEIAQRSLFWAAGYLASTSSVHPPDEFHNTWYGIGDPTECAFCTLALKAGLSLSGLEESSPRLKLFPFDSDRKRISAIRLWEGRSVSFIKGAVESILSISKRQIASGSVVPFSDADKRAVLREVELFESEALRVIGIAYKELHSETNQWQLADAESDVIFAGFVSMYDPPKTEVAEAVQDAFDAHIRIVMITGDHEVTARAVAKNIGLVNASGLLPRVVNEKQFAAMTETEMQHILRQRAVIFSRVSPDDKLRIVNVLKEMGEVVAMTGDGVNDTLSLKKADIGVAMGRDGSKVAQEAAAMVLLDDNFSTIVHAVKEGRTIFNNISKNVTATLASNTAELTCVLYGFVRIYQGEPIAILAIHILLIDLVGEMLPLLTLSFDPAPAGIMHEPPRKKAQWLNRAMLKQVLLSGVTRGMLAIGSFLIIYKLHTAMADQHETAMTGTFITIILTQFVNIFCIRTKHSIFSTYLLANSYLIWGIVISIIVMLMIVYLPILNLFLHTAPLAFEDWLIAIGASILYMLGYELTKWLVLLHNSKRAAGFSEK